MAPPQFNAHAKYTRTFRYTSLSGAVLPISSQDILQSAGCVAATTTSAYPIYNSLRIRKISIWTPPPSQGAAATCTVAWANPTGSGSVNSPAIEVSDTSVSTAQPATLVTRPPKLSIPSFWQQTSTLVLCNITAPTGSIIDLCVDLIHCDGLLYDNNVPVTIIGGTVGLTYYFALDGEASKEYTPVALATI